MHRPNLGGFIAFMRTKPARTKHDYWDSENCLLRQFANARGIPASEEYSEGITDYTHDIYDWKIALNGDAPEAKRSANWTFGAALSRALSLRSESPVGGKVGE